VTGDPSVTLYVSQSTELFILVASDYLLTVVLYGAAKFGGISH